MGGGDWSDHGQIVPTHTKLPTWQRPFEVRHNTRRVPGSSRYYRCAGWPVSSGSPPCPRASEGHRLQEQHPSDSVGRRSIPRNAQVTPILRASGSHWWMDYRSTTIHGATVAALDYFARGKHRECTAIFIWGAAPVSMPPEPRNGLNTTTQSRHAWTLHACDTQ